MKREWTEKMRRAFDKEAILSFLLASLGAASVIALLSVRQINEVHAAPVSKPAYLQEAVPHPNPNLKSDEVAEIILTSIVVNDWPKKDTGLQTVWNFTTPDSRGMWHRNFELFRADFKTGIFHNLLKNKEIQVGPTVLTEGFAQQYIKVSGSDGDEYYALLLQRQSGGRFSGCWMTNGFIPVPSNLYDEWEEKQDSKNASISPVFRRDIS